MLTTIKNFGKVLIRCLEIKSRAKVKYHLLRVTISSQTIRHQVKRLISFFLMLLLLLESSIDDPSNCNLDKLVITCEDYPSIIAIKNKCTELNSTFTFKKANKEQISIAIKRLDSKNT